MGTGNLLHGDGQSPLIAQSNLKLLANGMLPAHSQYKSMYRGTIHEHGGGLSPSENESSIVLFNALGNNLTSGGLGLHLQNSHPRSRAISGEEFNEFNYSNRQSCLAEKIEQLRNQSLKDEDRLVVGKLSIWDAAQ